MGADALISKIVQELDLFYADSNARYPYRTAGLSDKELTTDFTHDRQLLLSWKHVTVIHVR